MNSRTKKWALIMPKMSRNMTDYYCGILDYVKSRPDIFLEYYTFSDRDLSKLVEVDGIISYLMPPKEFRELFHDGSRPLPPTVVISIKKHNDSAFAYAQFNVREIVDAIFETLFRTSCRSYAFCASDIPYSEDASAAILKEFRRSVYAKIGKMPSVFRPYVSFSSNTVEAEIDRFTKWFAKMPHPCGMFVHSDRCAHKLLDTCRLRGIKVPDDLRVISTGNSEVFCERSYPTLTSYNCDRLKIGYNAAKALMDMIENSKTPDEVSFEIPFGAIVKRASTMDMRGSGRLSEAARRYIRECIDSGHSPTIHDIAFQLNVSVTKLCKDFREMNGHTIHEEIAKYRLGKLAKSLKASNMPIKELASRAGFATFSQASRSFKANFGKTMSEYRKGS